MARTSPGNKPDARENVVLMDQRASQAPIGYGIRNTAGKNQPLQCPMYQTGMGGVRQARPKRVLHHTHTHTHEVGFLGSVSLRRLRGVHRSHTSRIACGDVLWSLRHTHNRALARALHSTSPHALARALVLFESGPGVWRSS